MTDDATRSPERIVELWPSLDEDVRAALLEIAEHAASALNGDGFALSVGELESIGRASKDFAAGRTMTSAEMRASVAALLANHANRQ
jgi:hypothetical protein